jgi:hypothetical protein
MVQFLWGDGGGQHYPISSLPLSASHAWSAPGTYTITAVGPGGCTGQATTVITITTPAAPEPEATEVSGSEPFELESEAWTPQLRVARTLMRDLRGAGCSRDSYAAHEIRPCVLKRLARSHWRTARRH